MPLSPPDRFRVGVLAAASEFSDDASGVVVVVSVT
jgi:hypothetical protein